VQTTKVMVNAAADELAVLPVMIPDLDEVRGFARLLHTAAQAWEGEFYGWPCEYTPQTADRPMDSRLRFTPAEFWIGVSGVWFFSMMWEDGSERAPVEFLDDRGLSSAAAPAAP